MKNSTSNPTVTVSKESAKEVGLRYVSDTIPGISRVKSGKAFIYKEQSGKTIKDKKTLERIRALAIPPAYREVWICPYPNGHIQATGKDARGRKQYRYHEKWREIRDSNKYDKMIAFGYALPKIRRTTRKHLGLKKLPKEKVLATIVQLLDKTHIRVGNEEYAKTNQSFGLTTMRVKHVDVSGKSIEFAFTGKSGVKHDVVLDDKKLAKIVKQCQDLPGYELFQYLDENNERHSIHSEDVNAYLKEISGEDFTAKDFRTWHETVLACKVLSVLEKSESPAIGKKEVVKMVESVSKELGNTKAVCRKSYIHPKIIETYLDGTLPEILDECQKKPIRQLKALAVHEASLVSFLKKVK